MLKKTILKVLLFLIYLCGFLLHNIDAQNVIGRIEHGTWFLSSFRVTFDSRAFTKNRKHPRKPKTKADEKIGLRRIERRKQEQKKSDTVVPRQQTRRQIGKTKVNRGGASRWPTVERTDKTENDTAPILRVRLRPKPTHTHTHTHTHTEPDKTR